MSARIFVKHNNGTKPAFGQATTFDFPCNDTVKGWQWDTNFVSENARFLFCIT